MSNIYKLRDKALADSRWKPKVEPKPEPVVKPESKSKPITLTKK